MIDQLNPWANTEVDAYRLINAKYPPIALFDDVATADEFEALYAIQALTNPRLKAETGDLSILPKQKIPFGIPGCSYATASFTHVNPNGSRFSDGAFGVLYAASSEKTALTEVYHHQSLYWSNVVGLHYDRIVFKSLAMKFKVINGLDARMISHDNPIYSANDYAASRVLGAQIKEAKIYDTLAYRSVRNPQGECYALFTPQYITAIQQASHFEMIWDGQLNLPIKLSDVI